MDVFTLAAKLTLNTAEFTNNLLAMEQGMSGFGNTVVTIMKDAAIKGARLFWDAMKVGMDFDAKMSQVKAVSGATEEEFESLRAKAQEVGETTQFTATEAGEALYYMGLAGWKAEEMLGGIDGVINLAAASGENLGRVSDIVTDAITAFGLTADDTAHFVDVLAAASTNSNTTVGMMGEAFKYLATTGGVLGYTIDDVAFTLGLLANNGIKASQAGTSMRQILNTLINPTDKAAVAMENLGISLFEADTDKRKPLAQVIGELQDVFRQADFNLEGFSVEEQAQKLEELNKWYDESVAAIGDNKKQLEDFEKQYAEAFQQIMQPNEWFLSQLGDIGGLRGISSLFALMMADAKDVEQLSGAIENSNGAAQDMAETMLDNLKGDITILNSAIEGLQIAVSDEFKQPFRDFVQMLTGGISDLSASIRDNGLAGGIWAALFGDGSATDKVADAQSASDQTISGIEQTEQKALGLIERLGEMAENTEKTAVQMGIFKGLADELVTLVPSLAGQIDIQNGTLKTSTEELKENTRAWAENAKQQALNKALAEQQEVLAKTAQKAVDAEIKAGVADAKNVANIEAAITAANDLLSTYSDLSGALGFSSIDTSGNVIDQLNSVANAANWLRDAEGFQKTNDYMVLIGEVTSLQQEAETARQEAENLKADLEQATADYELYAQSIEAMMNAADQSAQTATGEVNNLNTAINSLPDTKTVRINVITDQPHFAYHAKGAASIPYDDYPAMLHRGEMVLTASQARKYREGENGGINAHSFAQIVAGAVRESMQNVAVRSYLNGKDITDDVQRRNAARVAAGRFA